MSSALTKVMGKQHFGLVPVISVASAKHSKNFHAVLAVFVDSLGFHHTCVFLNRVPPVVQSYILDEPLPLPILRFSGNQLDRLAFVRACHPAVTFLQRAGKI